MRFFEEVPESRACVQPSLNGVLPESTSGQDSGSLYDAATTQGNREAAAQCASKAEEALQQRDFDKAVSSALGLHCILSVWTRSRA